MDRIDRAILTELSQEGRLTHAELSARVALSPTACARRQRAMEESGIITGYQAVLGLARLGYATTVIVRITLDSQSEEAIDAFERAVASCPSVLRCFLMSGTDDYLITVSVRDIAHFEQVHRLELSRLPRVSRIQSNFALREVVNRGVAPATLGLRTGTESDRYR